MTGGRAESAPERAGERIGYARVSTKDQDPGSQEAELQAAGCARVFVDHGESSRVSDRPQWRACLDYLRQGDTVVVRDLGRLAGSERMAIDTISELHERGVNIRSLTEPDIDTTTSMGRALFGIVAVFAQLRVDTIRENTRRGLAHARAQGRVGGRPTVMTPERVNAAATMRAGGMSQREIATALGVGASSVRRALSRHDTRALQDDDVPADLVPSLSPRGAQAPAV
ncbi:recombinase family protein [Antribacter gilvus]|uniref:recombinase family protein n=1 Tax=Antribacter gilvus TaxID=2304675 RepID=UPI000F7720BB|nr:recombinase family protein [Antribacter gilvus]